VDRNEVLIQDKSVRKIQTTIITQNGISEQLLNVATKTQKNARGGTGIQTCLLILYENIREKRRWEIQSQYWTSIQSSIEKDRVTKKGEK
jgi:hypothetical protein